MSNQILILIAYDLPSIMKLSQHGSSKSLTNEYRHHRGKKLRLDGQREKNEK